MLTETVGRASSSGTLDLRSGSPPRLMMTLLGDYWLGRAEAIPSAALVDLIAVFGVTSASARATLSRMVKRDLLYSEKAGRNTFYRLTERSRQVLEEGATKLFDFGKELHEWDGLWSIIAFSIPEAKRNQRGSIRTRLRWQGFAPLYDGLWVSPHDLVTEALSACDALGVETATGIRGQIFENGRPSGSVLRAWDLDTVAADYREFAREACETTGLAKAGTLSDDESLRRRTNLMDEWRTFPTRDPRLPAQLLPKDWPMEDARKAFLAAYNALEPAAVLCVRDIIAAHDPATARAVFDTGR